MLVDLVISRLHTKSTLPHLKAHIEEKLERLSRWMDHLHKATVILDDGGHQHSVEICVSVDGGPRLVGHAESDDWLEAVNQAESKLETQIRRFQDRRRTKSRVH
ncbi:MAG: ribosome-associated translation inhibitor RaiA [Planctomycetota bacterium]